MFRFESLMSADIHVLLLSQFWFSTKLDGQKVSCSLKAELGTSAFQQPSLRKKQQGWVSPPLFGHSLSHFSVSILPHHPSHHVSVSVPVWRPAQVLFCAFVRLIMANTMPWTFLACVTVYTRKLRRLLDGTAMIPSRWFCSDHRPCSDLVILFWPSGPVVTSSQVLTKWSYSDLVVLFWPGGALLPAGRLGFDGPGYLTVEPGPVFRLGSDLTVYCHVLKDRDQEGYEYHHVPQPFYPLSSLNILYVWNAFRHVLDVFVFQTHHHPGAEWWDCVSLEEGQLHHNDVQTVQCADPSIQSAVQAKEPSAVSGRCWTGPTWRAYVLTNHIRLEWWKLESKSNILECHYVQMSWIDWLFGVFRWLLWWLSLVVPMHDLIPSCLLVSCYQRGVACLAVLYPFELMGPSHVSFSR